MKLGSDEAVSTSNMDMAHTRTEGTIGGKARYRWDGIIQLGRQDTYWKARCTTTQTTIHVLHVVAVTAIYSCGVRSTG